MKEIELKIPNLGEAEDTEIIEISVNKGDELKKNDPIIVLESEKAAMEVPSDFDGIVKEIIVKEGDSVREGTVFAILEVNEAQTDELNKQEKGTQDVQATVAETEITKKTESINIDFSGINAGPAVRKIARELEINLKNIIGSGKNKMITKDDLKHYIHSGISIQKEQYADLKSLEEFGDYIIENQTKVRKVGAKNLTQSWQSIPHVTHYEEADITKIETQRKDINKTSQTKLTPLAYILRVTALALKEFPIMNSSLIDDGKLMLKKYINIGVAVNTGQGLVVPVLKNVDVMPIEEIAKNILTISSKAKEKKLMKSDVNGSTFTISSLGNIGGVGFSPIINPPEVGILGISRAKNKLKLDGENIVEKTILPFSLSYDHRVINGVDAGNFMCFIKETLEKGL